MATQVAWPEALDSTVFGLRLVRPGSSDLRSDTSGKTLLVDRGETRYAGTFRVRPYSRLSDNEIADAVDYINERVSAGDTYTDMKIPRTSWATRGAVKGGSPSDITVASVGATTITLTQKSSTVAADPADGNLVEDPKQGALIRVNNRLARCENVSVAADGTVSFGLYPNLLTLVSAGDEIKAPDTVRARLEGIVLGTSTGASNLRGPWNLRWVEHVEDPLDGVTPRGVDRLIEIRDFRITLGQTFPLRLPPYWRAPGGGKLAYEHSQEGDSIALTLAGDTLNHKAVRTGETTITVLAREPVNGLYDEQIYVVVVEEPSTNRPPGIKRTIAPVSGAVGGHDFIDPLQHLADEDLDKLDFSGDSSNPAVATVRKVGGRIRVDYIGDGECTGFITGTDPSNRAVTLEFEILVAGILPGLPGGRGVDTGSATDRNGPYYGDSGVEGFERATFQASYNLRTSPAGQAINSIDFSDLDDYFGDFKNEAGVYTVQDITADGALTRPVVSGSSLNVRSLTTAGTARIRVTRTNQIRNKSISGEFNVVIAEAANPAPTVSATPVVPLTPSGAGRTARIRFDNFVNGQGSGFTATVKSNSKSAKVTTQFEAEDGTTRATGGSVTFPYIRFTRQSVGTDRDTADIVLTITQTALGQQSVDMTIRVLLPSSADSDVNISFSQPPAIVLKHNEAITYDRSDFITPASGMGLWSAVADPTVASAPNTGLDTTITYNASGRVHGHPQNDWGRNGLPAGRASGLRAADGQHHRYPDGHQPKGQLGRADCGRPGDGGRRDLRQPGLAQLRTGSGWRPGGLHRSGQQHDGRNLLAGGRRVLSRESASGRRRGRTDDDCPEPHRQPHKRTEAPCGACEGHCADSWAS